MKHSYDEQTLRAAITNSTSVRQALLKLGVAARGGNYKIIEKAVATYSIDTTHFKGKGWNKGTQQPKRDINDYLNGGIEINSFRLKNRLLQEGMLERRCCGCDNDTWLDNPIPVELDHIDGDSSNNRLNNLRLLCPNCHALTPTYRGKNKGRNKA